MPLQTITLLELRNQIKKESRVSGSDNLDQFIDDTINELLLDYTEKVRYFEMLLLNVPITLVDATGNYNLPADFQSLKFARYRRASGSPWTLNPRPQYVENARGRLPRWYEYAGGQIVVFPFAEVITSDVLMLDYYKYPAKLTADADVFPIPKLIVPLKRQVIFRTHTYSRDLPVAKVFAETAVEAEVRSRHSESDG